jgi:pantetheine-phosphate adenylyltransferase
MDFQPLLDKWRIKCIDADLYKLWNAPHRAYHTTTHLADLVEQIQRHSNLTQKHREMLLLTALFHDLIYDPQCNDNEDQSASFFLDAIEDPSPDHWQIAYMILDTKQHTPSSALSALFNQMDMAIVTRPLEDLFEWEKGIAYEYSFLPINTYIEKRIAFLQQIVKLYPENAHALEALIDHVQASASRVLTI